MQGLHAGRNGLSRALSPPSHTVARFAHAFRDFRTVLSICVTIQLLKFIKFTDALVPKMALMTSVLSRAMADLVFFGGVFMLAMCARERV